MDFKNIFLFKYLDVMCQRKKIGKIFGLIQKQLLVVKYLFWSIMPESILNMDGRPASISCSQELVMEPSLPLKRWGLQRSVSFPLCLLNKTNIFHTCLIKSSHLKGPDHLDLVVYFWQVFWFHEMKNQIFGEKFSCLSTSWGT